MNKQRVKQLKDQLIEDFASHPLSKPGDTETTQIEILLDVYYRHISSTDLEGEEAADLLGGVIAHWQLLKEWRKGECLVRVYNPNFEEHGWQSTHTIIEVVSRDMAFLVDSLSMVLNRIGMTIYLTIHPVVYTKRDSKGNLNAILQDEKRGTTGESLIRFQVEKQLSAEVLNEIRATVEAVIRDVGLANHDWLQMKEQVRLIRGSTDGVLPVDREDMEEAGALLDWISDDHFTFLAYACFDLDGETLVLNRESLLGLFRNTEGDGCCVEEVIPILGDQFSKFTGCMVVTKSNARSRVHRPAYMDCIGVKRYDAGGRVVGLHCILGLFTSAAYSSPPRDIPLLRKKTAEVLAGAGLSPKSHSGKALNNILDTYPRDSLFQTPTGELQQISLGILGLQERQITRIFISRDTFNRFYSCLIYLPRERFNRELRIRIERVLVDVFKGTEVEFNTFFTESILARIHYIVHTVPDAEVEIDRSELERRIVDAAMTWRDGLKSALVEQYGEAVASRYYREYSQAFPGGFREDFYPRTAASDIARIEKAREERVLGLSFYRPILEQHERVHLRLYSADQPVPLSEAIPILENMGLSVFGERPYRIRHQAGDVWIHDFSMSYASVDGQLTEEASRLFQEAFLKTWLGETDNDGFNQLVLAGGLSWKQVVLIRAYSQYLKQIKIPYSQSYIIDSLAKNPHITCLIVQLFSQRFDPDASRSEPVEAELLQAIESELEAVASLDQDKILRSFVNLVLATLRTNFYQDETSGGTKSYVSFKIDPAQVNDMPLPRPMFEIYVFSSRMEGVHLRGGKVARGGLRWSDRMEDYRTEVLGLMKAQMVKNTVIVPVGSKGGFVVKQPPAGRDREEVMREVVYCYRTFLRGMLDITDNLVAGEVDPPSQVVRRDPDDPYLVIAADKGTATFSDIANGVAADYGFWLGDAFASGGSAGYDHKKMGITARGAWESVKRNFRELGVDIQNSDFRVIGIGDMSGDVFGNGMLLSRHIRLVGAFNHMHIFLDPAPDPASSFMERERLFRLPRSSWEDYDAGLISKGGGIFPRSAKSIPLSEEVKALVGTKVDRMNPSELINALLKAPVDLLWNGGIGTYVKAESETNEDVGDKANDALRISGRELRCKVVGEGGNLGVTQLGRIEYAQRGGLIYTDAIDNSAGVDCSDHEVNIKILLGQIVSGGDLTEKQRNRLLVEMTDEVAGLVLSHNYAQTQAISMVASEAHRRLYEHARFMDHLEQRGALNRELEYLPTKKEIAERQVAKLGLTKPEIAVLHAYSKMSYYEALINSDIPDDEFLLSELVDYFPGVLGERFHHEMLAHRLKREIISTHLTNNIVDHIGPGFGFRVREEVGANMAGVTRAYLSASKIFGTDDLWRQIEALDNKVAASVQTEMMRLIAGMLEQAVKWILRSRKNNVNIRDLVDFFQPRVCELAGNMPKPLAARDRLALKRRIKALVDGGVPRELAQGVGALDSLLHALDVVEVANMSRSAPLLVATTYFNLGTELDLHWVREQIEQLGVQSHWHNMAKTRLMDTLNLHQRELTAQVVRGSRRSKSAKKMIAQWIESNQFAYERHIRMITELKARASVDFAMLSVVVAGVGGLLSMEV